MALLYTFSLAEPQILFSSSSVISSTGRTMCGKAMAPRWPLLGVRASCWIVKTILLVLVSAKTLQKQGGDLQSNAKVSNTHHIFKKAITDLCKDIWYRCGFSTFTWSFTFRVQKCYWILLNSCWSATGNDFSRTRWREMENTYNTLFSVLLPRPWHTHNLDQLCMNCYFLEGIQNHLHDQLSTGELEPQHTSRSSSDIFLLLTKMYRSSSSSSGKGVGGPSIRDLDLVWGRELRSGFLLKALLGNERLGSRFGPWRNLKAPNETGENPDSSCPYYEFLPQKTCLPFVFLKDEVSVVSIVPTSTQLAGKLAVKFVTLLIHNTTFFKDLVRPNVRFSSRLRTQRIFMLELQSLNCPPYLQPLHKYIFTQHLL